MGAAAHRTQHDSTGVPCPTPEPSGARAASVTAQGEDAHPWLVWLKISAASTPLKLLRVGVYWTARARHGLYPEEEL